MALLAVARTPATGLFAPEYASGALLNGMDTVLRQSTGLPVSIAEDPLLSVALGTGTALENMKNLGQVLDTAY